MGDDCRYGALIVRVYVSKCSRYTNLNAKQNQVETRGNYECSVDESQVRMGKIVEEKTSSNLKISTAPHA